MLAQLIAVIANTSMNPPEKPFNPEELLFPEFRAEQVQAEAPRRRRMTEKARQEIANSLRRMFSGPLA